MDLILSLTMGEGCKNCSQLKSLWERPTSLLFFLENGILLEKLNNLLDTVGVNYKQEENIISTKVENFNIFMKELECRNTLSDLELEDIWLMVLSEEESFRPSHLKGARSLKFWLSQLACCDYLNILQRESLLVYFHPHIG
ncbi:MAG: hypothetical protein RMI51_01395 [Aquificaceae bacterium]|nr:hypothetical protein [Aquificaceae bacterium]